MVVYVTEGETANCVELGKGFDLVAIYVDASLSVSKR